MTIHARSKLFNIGRDKGKIVIDLARLPDDPGKRADIDYALRILAHHGMIEDTRRSDDDGGRQ